MMKVIRARCGARFIGRVQKLTWTLFSTPSSALARGSCSSFQTCTLFNFTTLCLAMLILPLPPLQAPPRGPPLSLHTATNRPLPTLKTSPFLPLPSCTSPTGSRARSQPPLRGALSMSTRLRQLNSRSLSCTPFSPSHRRPLWLPPCPKCHLGTPLRRLALATRPRWARRLARRAKSWGTSLRGGNIAKSCAGCNLSRTTCGRGLVRICRGWVLSWMRKMQSGLHDGLV